MDSKGTSWLKKEKNEVYAEPGSFVQLHTSTMKLKELDEKVNQQFLEGPLKIVMPSLHIKQDLELKQEDGIERDVSKLKIKVVFLHSIYPTMSQEATKRCLTKLLQLSTMCL
ncbi:uncharacterized protein LOC126426925 isoform X6 [Schistocerca serialis cubense]|uniref:uncharacterized protein LOC126426925 isoform X6 n=1 Tax=Schistocerca serialis cubense TaxID=2023355 RepID=UPI00214EF2FE|nr:uncharacterized protein LOC126426925 isoform X6 [Schistocerca serialis cubense]